ncbi:transcriptional regulator FtrA [Roseateles flavus]|uniref:Transcriptional regulator FtrA n=1 Tax=Roseateles flavus TaxID=3149041 RepID=A0ABV0GHQ7_9BURK
MHALHESASGELTGPLVVALAHDGLCTFEFAIVAEVFGLSRPEMGRSWYRYATAAVEPGPLRAHGGLTFTASGGIELLDQADLIVAAGWKGAGVPVPAELAARLRSAWERGARLASICSGAFVLAATDLLNGRRAATHWRYADQLAACHPEIEVDADVLYVEEDRIYTSAGSAAGIDLMLHIIRQDHGAEAANCVARRLVMPPHRSGGQAQFIERAVPPDRGHRLTEALDRIRSELSADWTVERMAALVAMSPRTFLRRFVEATALSPGQWLIEQRVVQAQRLLERTALSVEQVAAEVGFGSVQGLRHHFRERLTLSPRDYRKAFASGARPAPEASGRRAGP